MTSPLTAFEERTGELQLAFACLIIALGGVLLGVQIDGNGAIAGTGYTTLGLGGIVALAATLIQLGAAGRLPRTPLAVLSATCGFAAITFLVAGVLAPGGAWMFWELVVLAWVLARRRRRSQPGGPEVGLQGFLLLASMLIFRLWITWQAAQHEWQLFTVDVPLISALPFPWLAPIQTITVGDFTQHEMGFPPTGLDFALSMSLWAAGFALCATGLWMRNQASREVEIERIHRLIQTLPPAACGLVLRVLPEEEWEQMGLFGLPERRLALRVARLVEERLQRQMAFETAFRTSNLLGTTTIGGPASSIHEALLHYDPEGLPEPEATPLIEGETT